jgi:hypothetical protein
LVNQLIQVNPIEVTPPPEVLCRCFRFLTVAISVLDHTRKIVATKWVFQQEAQRTGNSLVSDGIPAFVHVGDNLDQPSLEVLPILKRRWAWWSAGRSPLGGEVSRERSGKDLWMDGNFALVYAIEHHTPDVLKTNWGIGECVMEPTNTGFLQVGHWYAAMGNASPVHPQAQ